MGSEWQARKVGDVALTNTDTYSPKEEWEYVNYLDTGNITAGVVDSIQIIPREGALPSRARRKVKAGDIVYSTVRPNQRHYGIIDKPLKNMLISTGFTVIRGNNENCDTKFLYYFLTQDGVIERLQTIGEHSTSAYPSIKPSDIESLDILLPPLPEQRAIAHILGSLDDKIELNRRMNETLEAMAQVLFKSWFIDFDPIIDNVLAAGSPIPEELQARAALRESLGGARKPLPDDICNLFPSELEFTEKMGWIPKGWEVGSLSNIATLNPESWTAKTAPAQLLYVDLANTKNGRINLIVPYQFADAPSRARRVLRQDDTILCGVFERGSTPVEVPEMRTAARQIIERLKADKEQFSALLKSIGVAEAAEVQP